MNNLFVVKFNKAQTEPFRADNNGNMPFIGTLLAGKAHNTIINGTIGIREGIEENVIYMCMNTEAPDYVNPETGEVSKQWNVTIISKVSPLELVALNQQLGAPQLLRNVAGAETPDNEEANADDLREGAM